MRAWGNDSTDEVDLPVCSVRIRSDGLRRRSEASIHSLRAQQRLPSIEGWYLEPSAAICLPVVERLLASGWIEDHESVVMIGTSADLKDIEATASRLPPVPLIEPTLDASLSASPKQPNAGRRHNLRGPPSLCRWLIEP